MKYWPAPDLVSLAFFFQQAFVEVAQAVALGAEPVDLVE